MITVAILINGHPVMARSATNQQKVLNNGDVEYLVDDGTKVYHNPKDGAVVLSKKLLDTIKQ